MTKDQELRLALEEIRTKSVCQTDRTIAKDALRKALEQPEPEPVAWMDEFGNIFPLGAQRGPKYLNEPMKPLYTSPPKREWQGLTDEEVFDIWLNEMPAPDKVFYQKLCRSVEAKLKEKNA